MSSIQEKVLIVRLHISKWNPWGYDREAARKVAEDKGAKKEDVHTTKRKIAKKAIQKITDLMSNAYMYHISMTMPSGTEGDRLITTNLYSNYCEKMSGYKHKIDEAVDEFIPNYPQWIEDARSRLGSMFKESDYPPASEVRMKFNITYSFLPLPSVNNIVVDLVNGEVSKIRQSVEEEMNRVRETAMGSLWNRMYDSVAHMAERLSNREAIFRDSLVGNVQEQCDILKSLNFSNDPELESMRQRIEVRLAGRDPNELRKSRSIREDVAREAQAIVVEISEKRKLRLE